MRELDTPDEGASTGFAPLDDEHEAQFRLLDAFENAVRRGLDDTVLDGMLQQFIEHTNVQFLSEQLLMRLHAYEAYESHLQEHDRLMTEIRHLRGGIPLGEVADIERLIEALRNWLVVHIHTTDSVLGEYLSRQSAPLPGREEA